MFFRTLLLSGLIACRAGPLPAGWVRFLPNGAVSVLLAAVSAVQTTRVSPDSGGPVQVTDGLTAHTRRLFTDCCYI